MSDVSIANVQARLMRLQAALDTMKESASTGRISGVTAGVRSLAHDVADLAVVCGMVEADKERGSAP